MLFPEHFLTVSATVEAGREDEFNHWYNTEHTPDAVRLWAGCIGAARYKVTTGDGSHQYMAMYAFGTAAELEAAMAGPGVQEMIKIYDKAVGSFSTRKRTTYTKVFQFMKTA